MQRHNLRATKTSGNKRNAMTNRIAFIGGGNMALALASRLAASSPAGITVAEPAPEQRARFDASIATTDDNLAAARDASVIILAVKPQVLEAVTRQIAPGVSSGQLVISIAAGVPISAIERWLVRDCAVVRCMPNTPALIGKGISGLVANSFVSDAQRKTAADLLGVAGEVIWFESDADLDIVTALSGSGPAYFFYVIEALAGAAVRLGLRPEVAKRLTVATAIGAAAMAADDDPEALRERVTSPGGTTERALAILAEKSLPEALDAAVRGAFHRSRELAEEFGNP